MDVASRRALPLEEFGFGVFEQLLHAQLWKIIDDLPETAKLLTFANTKRRIDYLYDQCWKAGYGDGARGIYCGHAVTDAVTALFAEGMPPV
jgi:superfamily II DNA/RNA helicase